MSEETGYEESEAEITDSTEAEVSVDESTDEGEEIAEESVEESAEEAPVEDAGPKMFRTNVLGEESFVTEEEMIADYQSRKASAKVFRDASEARKKSESIMSGMRDNPVQALLDAGMSMEEVQEAFYSQTKKFLDLSDETDEQRAAREEKEELIAFREERVRLKEEREAGNAREEALRYETDIESEFTAALEEGNIPSSPQAISRIAQIQIMSLNSEDPIEMSVHEAAQVYHRERKDDVNTMFGGMSVEQMMEWIGPDRMKAVRKHDLGKIGSKASNPRTTKVAPKEGNGKPQSAADFFKNLK